MIKFHLTRLDYKKTVYQKTLNFDKIAKVYFVESMTKDGT